MQKRKVKKAELRMSVLGRKVMTNLVSQSVKLLSRVQLLAIPWTAAYQASPSMEFSRQEYWSGLPFPSPKRSSPPRDRTWVSHLTGRQTLYRLSHQES